MIVHDVGKSLTIGPKPPDHELAMSLTNSSFFDIVYFVDPNTYLDRTVEVWKKSPLRYGLLTARDTAFFLCLED